MSNTPKHSTAELLRDPELPLDDQARAALSEDQRREAERQRRLDHDLRAAAGELHAHVDARQPDWGAFEMRLRNVLETESEASPEYDFLRRMRLRERLTRLKERLIFSEQSGLRWAAAAALFAIVLTPIAFVSNETAGPELALSESEEADESFTAPTRSEDAGRAPWFGGGEAPPAPPRQTEDSASGPEQASPQKQAARSLAEQPGASDAAPELSKSERAMLQVQVKVLRDKLERAETREARLGLLRQLETLYARDALQSGKELKAVRQAIRELQNR